MPAEVTAKSIIGTIRTKTISRLICGLPRAFTCTAVRRSIPSPEMPITSRQDDKRHHEENKYHLYDLIRTNVLSHYSTFVRSCKRQFLYSTHGPILTGSGSIAIIH